MQLIEIEQAFKELKHGLAIRPIFHRREERIGTRGLLRLARRSADMDGDERERLRLRIVVNASWLAEAIRKIGGQEWSGVFFAVLTW